MTRIAVIDARKDLAEILNRAAYGKERIVLTRRGKDVAAIVPMDDLSLLEAIEDRVDVVESEKVLDRVRAGSEQLLSLKEVKAKYQAAPAFKVKQGRIRDVFITNEDIKTTRRSQGPASRRRKRTNRA